MGETGLSPDERSARPFVPCGKRKRGASIRSCFGVIPSLLLVSTTIRAIVMDSEMMQRARGLQFCISLDSTRANFTAATSPVTIATIPVVRAARSRLRSHALHYDGTAVSPWVKFASADTLERALRYLGPPRSRLERMACDAANRAGKQSRPAAANRKNLFRFDWSKL